MVHCEMCRSTTCKASVALTLWSQITSQAEQLLEREPLLASAYRRQVLDHSCFEAALGAAISANLFSANSDNIQLRHTVAAVLREHPDIATRAADDLISSFDRDPACANLLDGFLNARGFMALVTHRICHALWHDKHKELAGYIHGVACRFYSVDIHPAAAFGSGIFIDHAMGLVVGETARIGDNVSILHGVTLGGTGKETGDRHPKVGSGVLLGAQATILGNITIGDNAKVGAGSVVLHPVPAGVTVVGVPAHIVDHTIATNPPAFTMNHELLEGPLSATAANVEGTELMWRRGDARHS